MDQSGTIAEQATDAFAALGNEHRLEIMLALWEAYEPFADDNAVAFNELYDAVDIDDSGQFNYHLDTLEGEFVRKTESGYELRRSGRRIVQTVIASAGFEESSFDRIETDIECNSCGGDIFLSYDDEWLHIICSNCEGSFNLRSEDVPEGLLEAGDFEPAGLLNRTPEEIYLAWQISSQLTLTGAWYRICTHCMGRMVGTLSICDQHDPEGICETCGATEPYMARFRCSVCKNHHMFPPHTLAMFHPHVAGFADRHGIHSDDGRYDLETHEAFSDLASEATNELISTDPPIVAVTIRYEGETIEVRFDDELNVLEFSIDSDDVE